MASPLASSPRRIDAVVIDSDLSTHDLQTTPDEEKLPGDVKQARLLRHRESCRKSYSKKGTTISALKHELEAVERTYNALLSRQLSDPSAREDDDDDATVSRRRAYLALTQLKRDLVLENEELYQLNATSMRLEGRLQQMLDLDAPPVAGPLPVQFVPLSQATSAHILKHARDDVLQFVRCPHKFSLRASVFGWTDCRQVRGNELKFALEKQFPTLSARELVKRTWRVVASEQRCAQLFNPTLQVTLQILQRVDDNTLLMYRTIQADALAVTAKTVFLLTRIRVPEGYLVLFRSIDPSLVGFLDDARVDQAIEEALLHSGGPHHHRARSTHQDVWIEKYAWAVVHDDGARGCRFHFGGSTMSNVWLKEVLFIALRWEQQAVGPALQLTL